MRGLRRFPPVQLFCWGSWSTQIGSGTNPSKIKGQAGLWGRKKHDLFVKDYGHKLGCSWYGYRDSFFFTCQPSCWMTIPIENPHMTTWLQMKCTQAAGMCEWLTAQPWLRLKWFIYAPTAPLKFACYEFSWLKINHSTVMYWSSNLPHHQLWSPNQWSHSPTKGNDRHTPHTDLSAKDLQRINSSTVIVGKSQASQFCQKPRLETRRWSSALWDRRACRKPRLSWNPEKIQENQGHQTQLSRWVVFAQLCCTLLLGKLKILLQVEFYIVCCLSPTLRTHKIHCIRNIISQQESVPKFMTPPNGKASNIWKFGPTLQKQSCLANPLSTYPETILRENVGA